MKRVAIIGSGGAGKSTVARRLGEITGIEVIHLDALFWRPGWVETPRDEWHATVRALTERPAWIMDGNYGGTLDLRLAAADTMIFLDLPRSVCLWSVVQRRLRFAGRSRPDMAPGCPERLSFEFVRWVWDYPRTRRSGVLRLLAEHAGHATIVRLRSRADVRRFLSHAKAQRRKGRKDDG